MIQFIITKHTRTKKLKTTNFKQKTTVFLDVEITRYLTMASNIKYIVNQITMSLS